MKSVSRITVTWVAPSLTVTDHEYHFKNFTFPSVTTLDPKIGTSVLLYENDADYFPIENHNIRHLLY